MRPNIWCLRCIISTGIVLFSAQGKNKSDKSFVANSALKLPNGLTFTVQAKSERKKASLYN